MLYFKTDFIYVIFTFSLIKRNFVPIMDYNKTICFFIFINICN